jgi:hypothetical protein
MTHFIRKRDGQCYICLLQPVTWPGYKKLGPCYIQVRVEVCDGCAHYKTIKAFEREYERAKN